MNVIKESHSIQPKREDIMERCEINPLSENKMDKMEEELPPSITQISGEKEQKKTVMTTGEKNQIINEIETIISSEIIGCGQPDKTGEIVNSILKQITIKLYQSHLIDNRTKQIIESVLSGRNKITSMKDCISSEYQKELVEEWNDAKHISLQLDASNDINKESKIMLFCK